MRINQVLLAVSLVTSVTTGYAESTTTNYRDAYGTVTGSSVNYGNGNVQYRDVNGSVVGSSYNGNGSSNTTNYTDSYGSVIGSSYGSNPNNDPQPIRPLNRDSWQAR